MNNIKELLKDTDFDKWYDKYSEKNHSLKGWLDTDTYLDEVELPEDIFLFLVQRYLREEYDLHIEILLEDGSPYDKFYFRVMGVGHYFTLSHHGLQDKDYNKVLEAGIIDAIGRTKEKK